MSTNVVGIFLFSKDKNSKMLTNATTPDGIILDAFGQGIAKAK